MAKIPDKSCPLKPCDCLCRSSVRGLQIDMATVKEQAKQPIGVMRSAWGDSSSHAEAPWERLRSGHGDSGAAPLMPLRLLQGFPSLDPRLVIPPTGRLRVPVRAFRINWLHQAEQTILKCGFNSDGQLLLGTASSGFQPAIDESRSVPQNETDPIAPTDSPADALCSRIIHHGVWPAYPVATLMS